VHHAREVRAAVVYETGVVCSHLLLIDDRIILEVFIAGLISFEFFLRFLEHNSKL